MTDDFIRIKNFGFKRDKLLSFGLAWENRSSNESETVVRLVMQLVLEQPDKASKVTLFGQDASETIAMYADLLCELGVSEHWEGVAMNMAKEMGVDLVAKPQTSPSPPSSTIKGDLKDGKDHLDGQ